MEKRGELRQGYMHTWEGVLWWTGIIFTFGFLYPVYRHRKNSLHRRTTIYG